MGATLSQVYSAAYFLHKQSGGTRQPEMDWLYRWIRRQPDLHTITTKPIDTHRVDTHTWEDVEGWFVKYQQTLDRYKITRGANIWNMDETGARVGCPTSEKVVVHYSIKSMYNSSPENRKSVTIIEAICTNGDPPIPPFVICPGKRIMKNWVSDNLDEATVISLSDSGYTNEDIALDWLAHFVKHTHSGPTKPWKLLLMDGHISHAVPLFTVRAAENHIVCMTFPSHLTHILQALDVGIFRSWKHFQNLAIQESIRTLDFEYTVASFFRDLNKIRESSFKSYTIVNTFRDSGTWPINRSIVKKKMIQYSSKEAQRTKRKNKTSSPNQDESELPPPSKSASNYAYELKEFAYRVPDQ